MATTYKVLGQVNPAATTATTAYTVASSTEAVISTIVVANRDSTSKTFTIILRPNDETLADKHYLAKDITVGASDTTALTLGITMDATDKLYVSGSDTYLSFTAFGSEITA